MTSEPTDQITQTSEQIDPQSYQSWSLPHVTSDRLVSSAEKEASERKKQRFKRNKEPRKTGPVDEAAGESIEVVETIEETFKPLTADQLREITEAAEKEGYEAGYKKGLEIGEKEGIETGYQTGLDKSDQKVVERCERVEHIIEALLIPLQSERKKLEIVMVDMIAQLTQAVVLRELALDSTQIIKLVDEAINAVPAGSDKFSLYLNAQDIALVESHLNDQSEKQFNYYTDDDLLPGGCRLETKNTVVSHTVEQRLEKVIGDFTNKRIVASDEEILEVTNSLDNINEESLTNTESTTTANTEIPVETSMQKHPSETDINTQEQPDNLETQILDTSSEAQLIDKGISEKVDEQTTEEQHTQPSPQENTNLVEGDDNAEL